MILSTAPFPAGIGGWAVTLLGLGLAVAWLAYLYR